MNTFLMQYIMFIIQTTAKATTSTRDARYSIKKLQERFVRYTLTLSCVCIKKKKRRMSTADHQTILNNGFGAFGQVDTVDFFNNAQQTLQLPLELYWLWHQVFLNPLCWSGLQILSCYFCLNFVNWALLFYYNQIMGENSVILGLI